MVKMLTIFSVFNVETLRKEGNHFQPMSLLHFRKDQSQAHVLEILASDWMSPFAARTPCGVFANMFTSRWQHK